MQDNSANLPRKVSVVEGDVVIDDPSGVAIRLTPEAALITSARLASCADEARGDWLDSHNERWSNPPRP